MFINLQLHTRRVSPINSQLPATSLIAIELVDGPLPILTPLEDDSAEAQEDFSLAATNVIPEPGNIPHQQRPERAEEVLELPHPEARRQVAQRVRNAAGTCDDPWRLYCVLRQGILHCRYIIEIAPIDVVERAEVLHVVVTVVISADVADVLLWGPLVGHDTKPNHAKVPYFLLPYFLICCQQEQTPNAC